MNSDHLRDWEIEWVKKNTHFYRDQLHVEHVIHCIKQRYLLNEMKKAVQCFHNHGTTGNKFAMFEIFGIETKW